MRADRVVIGGLLLVAVAAAILGGWVEWDRQGQAGTSPVRAAVLVGAIVVGASWALIGGVVAWLRPRHPLGWLMLGVGTLTQLSLTEEATAQAGLHGAVIQGSAWEGRTAGLVLSVVVGLAIYVLVGLLPALYPSGRLPSPLWRWPCGAVVLGAVLLQAQWLRSEIRTPGGESIDAGPFGLGYVPMLLFGVGALSVWCLCVQRLVRATSPERQQIAWLLVSVVALILTQFLGQSTAALAVQMLCLYLLPVAISVGILRYRLLGIEAVLRRSLVYGLLTAIIVALYAGVAAFAGVTLTGSTLPMVVTAAIVAVGLNPFRTHLQLIVDRFLYGDRSDPMRAVGEVGSRVAAAAEHELLGAVLMSMQAAVRSAAMRIRGADGVVLAQVGDPLSFHVDSPDLGFTTDLTVSGTAVGTLEVADRQPGERFSAQDLVLLRSLTPQAAVVVRALQLTTELNSERDAVIRATGKERERLRRDLHDGLGPALTGASLGLRGLSDALTAGDLPRSQEITDVLQREVSGAAVEIHRILTDLRPASLAEDGLAGALHRRIATAASPIPIEVRIQALPTLSPDIEEAVYRVAGEAVTNVLKHSGATRATVDVGTEDDGLYVRVSDDGGGFSEPLRAGIGLASMRDRAHALGGELTVETSADGTVVTFSIPLKVSTV